MDPISALSIAAAASGFLNLAGVAVIKGLRYYHFATDSHIRNELEGATKELNRICTAIATEDDTQSHQLTAGDIALRELAKPCHRLANDLISELDSLRPRTQGNRYKNFTLVLRGMMKDGKIRDLDKRLDLYRRQFALSLLTALKDDQSTFMKEIRDLQATNKAVATSVESVDERVKALTAKIKALDGELQKSDRDRDASSQQSGDNRSQSQLPATTHAAMLGKEISNDLLQLADQSDRCTKIKRILDSLRFTGMEARREQIADAHRRTCDWILDESRPVSCPNPEFMKWLNDKSGFYWISGKAGSGKSTLIKFLSRSTKVRQALKAWAGSEELVIASHFFWNAGTKMQKTKDGLFRTLVYEVLCQCPRLIPEVAAGRWASDTSQHPEKKPWTTSELTAAFERLRSREIALPRMCFYIDGLDECSEGPEEVIEIIAPFALCLDIKICLSSRPWNQFETFFGKNNNQLLRLQDFNTTDISLYVTEVLEESEDFQELRAKDPRYTWLGSQISREAKGVFLWAALAVRSILRGLSNADPFRLLEERLRSFPKDIDQMYKTMFASIETVYNRPMVRTFQTMMFLTTLRYSSSPLLPAVLDFAFLDESDPCFVEKMVITRCDHDESHNRCVQTGKRINAWTAGLLDVRHNHGTGQIFCDCKVDFIHKTLRDFLESEGTKMLLQGKMKILAGRLLGYHDAIANQNLDDYGPDAMIIARETIRRLEHTTIAIIARKESEHGDTELQILNDLEHVLQLCVHLVESAANTLRLKHPIFGATFKLWTRPRQEPGFLMRTAIAQNLLIYITKRLERDPGFFYTVPWSPLMIAVIGVDHMYTAGPMVKLFLDHSADVNVTIVGIDCNIRREERSPSPTSAKDISNALVEEPRSHNQSNDTPWTYLLSLPVLYSLEWRCLNPSLPLPVFWVQKWFEIVEMMIRNNADMDVVVVEDDGVMWKPRDIIYKYCTEEQIAQLQDILDPDRAVTTHEQPGPWNYLRIVIFTTWIL